MFCRVIELVVKKRRLEQEGKRLPDEEMQLLGDAIAAMPHFMQRVVLPAADLAADYHFARDTGKLCAYHTESGMYMSPHRRKSVKQERYEAAEEAYQKSKGVMV